MCQRGRAASSRQNKVAHLGQFVIQAVYFPPDTGDRFRHHLTFYFQFRVFLIGCQIGTDRKQLVLDKQQEVLIRFLFKRSDQQPDKRVQFVDRTIAFDTLVRFRYPFAAN